MAREQYDQQHNILASHLSSFAYHYHVSFAFILTTSVKYATRCRSFTIQNNCTTYCIHDLSKSLSTRLRIKYSKMMTTTAPVSGSATSDQNVHVLVTDIDMHLMTRWQRNKIWKWSTIEAAPHHDIQAPVTYHPSFNHKLSTATNQLFHFCYQQYLTQVYDHSYRLRFYSTWMTPYPVGSFTSCLCTPQT